MNRNLSDSAYFFASISFFSLLIVCKLDGKTDWQTQVTEHAAGGTTAGECLHLCA